MQIEAGVQLDSIITVVDAINIDRQLHDTRSEGAVNEAQVQIAYADLILLNKVYQGEGINSHLYSFHSHLSKYIRCRILEHGAAAPEPCRWLLHWHLQHMQSEGGHKDGQDPFLVTGCSKAACLLAQDIEHADGKLSVLTVIATVACRWTLLVMRRLTGRRLTSGPSTRLCTS
jgi:hypothetical protein